MIDNLRQVDRIQVSKLIRNRHTFIHLVFDTDVIWSDRGLRKLAPHLLNSLA